MLPLTAVKTEIESKKEFIIIRYAWGWKKTWIISKDKKIILPKGSRLLMILYCRKTNKLLQTSENYPIIGDVVSDINGEKLEIIDIKFA